MRINTWKLRRRIFLLVGLCSGAGVLVPTVLAEPSTIAGVTKRVQPAANSIQPTAKKQAGKTQSLLQLTSLYRRDPVNAKLDRVWKLIPGLEGWKLNESQTFAASERANDGMYHLVWDVTAPTITVSSLGAHPIYRGCESERSVALMFNVSWGEGYLPSLLATLKKAHVKATFFLDGAWVKQNPGLAKQIATEGHDIGSHGTGHKLFTKLTEPQIVNQLVQTNQKIYEVTGKTVDLFAPPAGDFDNRVVRLGARQHMSTILWTADTVDWRRPPASAIVARIATRVTPGALILMHPTAPTAEALPQLLSMLTQKGYVYKTVDDVVHQKLAVTPPSRLSKEQ